MNRLPLQCDETHALKCALASEILRTYGTLRLQVTGWSMMPAVRPQDILVLETVIGEDLADGDIVLFERENRLFAHRVVKTLDHSGVVTRGDAMPAEDPVLRRTELLGRVRWIERNGEMIIPHSKPSVAAGTLAALVRHSRLAARLIQSVHTRLQF